MPVYEFACNACNARVSIFVRSINSPLNGVCDGCGSTDLRRLISRVAIIRSDDSGLEDMDMGGLDENDPRAMAQWMRKMQREMGEDGGPEMEQMLQRLESGESLDEGDLGDFGDMGGFGGDMGMGHSHDDDLGGF